jgi:hypothetical protein
MHKPIPGGITGCIRVWEPVVNANSFKAHTAQSGAPCIMADEAAWAAMAVFAVGVVVTLELFGDPPAGLVLIVGLFAAVLLPGIGVRVPGEIRDGLRDAR